jgi:hypothetical protein
MLFDAVLTVQCCAFVALRFHDASMAQFWDGVTL